MALFAVGFLSLICAVRGLDLKVVEPSGFVKLSSWGQSALYRVQAASDYDDNPLLLHLVGARYGEWVGLHSFLRSFTLFLTQTLATPTAICSVSRSTRLITLCCSRSWETSGTRR